MEGGGCGFISALMAVINTVNLEETFPPCMYGGNIDEEEMDAHSEQQKSLLIQHDITQALSSPAIGLLVL